MVEAVKEFTIEVDLSDCQRLYAYGKQEMFDRPATGWDPAQLEALLGKKDQDPADETAAFRVGRLDKALSDKGCFEKKAETEDASEEFDTLFPDFSFRGKKLPLRTLPLYALGDVVKGHLSLELSENVEAESLVIQLLGRASTNIRVYHGKGYYDDRGRIDYLNDKKILWQKSDGKTTSDKDRLLAAGAQTGSYIPAGKHRFTYEFTIPADALPSVPPLVASHADYAFISWRLKATINKGKVLKRGNIVTHQGIWVERPVNSTFNNNPEFMTPVLVEEERETGLFGKGGKIACRINLPRKIYARCDVVPVRLEVDNNSDSTIDEVKASVQMTGRYRAKDSKWHGSRSIKVSAVRVREGTVPAKTSPVYNLQLPLDFNDDGVDGNLIPVGTLDDCPIIDVEYKVFVVLKRKGLHRNITLEAPIMIGSGKITQSTMYPSLNA